VIRARGKGKRGCSQGTEGLYTLGEALGRGKEELDAGDVVAARENGHQGLASGGGDALEVEVALVSGVGQVAARAARRS
jgi:hypothetical protein